MRVEVELHNGTERTFAGVAAIKIGNGVFVVVLDNDRGECGFVLTNIDSWRQT